MTDREIMLAAEQRTDELMKKVAGPHFQKAGASGADQYQKIDSSGYNI